MEKFLKRKANMNKCWKKKRTITTVLKDKQMVTHSNKTSGWGKKLKKKKQKLHFQGMENNLVRKISGGCK